jgi:hypothetical protein
LAPGSVWSARYGRNRAIKLIQGHENPPADTAAAREPPRHVARVSSGAHFRKSALPLGRRQGLPGIDFTRLLFRAENFSDKNMQPQISDKVPPKSNLYNFFMGIMDNYLQIRGILSPYMVIHN